MHTVTGTSIERLVSATTEVIVVAGPGPVAIAHWGPPLGDDADLDAVLAACELGPVPGTSVWSGPLPVVPEHGSGFDGRPGLVGSRSDGRDFAPRFTVTDVTRHATSVTDSTTDTTGRSGRADDTLTVTAVDRAAGLEMVTELTLGAALSVSCTLTNTGDDEYRLSELMLSLPVPEHAGELLCMGGRWMAEFGMRRRPWPDGTHSAQNRRGRTSHESVPLVVAVEPGTGAWSGSAWAAHLAWSGNHQWSAERTVDGRRQLQLGELLHAGEVVLRPGEQYRSPEIVAVHSSEGLTPIGWGFHRTLRAHETHARGPRPVTFNSWEAVYFDHDAQRLSQLVALAADVGVERFVLDDGWFGGRRDDTAGLGDWWVSPEAHPEGLAPLIGSVHAAGMQFGIWVEPEMVNPDSELLRSHPDWALVDDRYEPVLHRNQLVLDITRADAFDHVHGALDRLLADHAIDFVKWDMNRPHVQAAQRSGAAGTHRQTLALYRLLDMLRAAHPHVEFESCSSGGARIDHAVLRRTDRVWPSDSNDPLERQRIQSGASLLIPPEVMGSHIGPRRTHTTGRVHDITFRAITALFGHLGIEADLVEFDERELEVVRAAIELYREHRGLLHGGDTVRLDLDGPWLAHGVYATDRSRALVSVAALELARTAVMGPLRLPGLDPTRRYRVTPLLLPHAPRSADLAPSSWWRDGVLVATGRQLSVHGLRLPTLQPASALLLQVDALEPTDGTDGTDGMDGMDGMDGTEGTDGA